MSSAILSKKKQKKVQSILYSNKQGKKQKQFVRSYSQLLNKHFAQSSNQKSSLRRRVQSALNFRTKKLKKQSENKQTREQTTQKKQVQDKKQSRNNSFSLTTSLFHVKSQFKFSLQEDMLDSKMNEKLRVTQLNPQKNEIIEKIILSKTQQLKKNSLQNVSLVQKLNQNTQEKKNLTSLLQNLKLQILKQKKTKAKLSTQMGKLMNKLEVTNSTIQKLQEERYFMKEQTKLTQKQYFTEQQKNKQLKAISSMNQQKMKIQNELIQTLAKNIQKLKNQYFETKTHTNELKSIFTQQSKCLLKMEMNYNQASHERDLLCKVVQSSVINIKEKSKY